MTALLEKVFNEAKRLPEIEQNFIARRWLQELESESQWDHQFAESEDELAQLAEEALLSEMAEPTEPLNMNQL